MHENSFDNHNIIKQIKDKVCVLNYDNITRTMAYQQFYLAHKEIQWAFLASMVSRNTGYFMTDLQTSTYKNVFSETYRTNIFLTYEEGNWLIFEDAYPQLLLYEYSKKTNKPQFHLLSHFFVSSFMKKEWLYFWKYKDKKRLMIALIINEQQMLEQYVIKNPTFQKNVFQTIPYKLEQVTGASMVIFPTLKGALYGREVRGFLMVDKRIKLGVDLSYILFKEELLPAFEEYAFQTEHTGFRTDYEQYMNQKQMEAKLDFRTLYEKKNHERVVKKDWYKENDNLAVYIKISTKNVRTVTQLFRIKGKIIKSTFNTIEKIKQYSHLKKE